MIYSWFWISNHFEVRMSDWECTKTCFSNSTFHKICNLDLNMYISDCTHVRWLYSVPTFLFTCKVSNICQIIQSHVPSFFRNLLTKLTYFLTPLYNSLVGHFLSYLLSENSTYGYWKWALLKFSIPWIICIICLTRIFKLPFFSLEYLSISSL